MIQAKPQNHSVVAVLSPLLLHSDGTVGAFCPVVWVPQEIRSGDHRGGGNRIIAVVPGIGGGSQFPVCGGNRSGHRCHSGGLGCQEYVPSDKTWRYNKWKSNGCSPATLPF